MAATNSVAKRTGNVSAGTSVFAMVVLEKELKKVYPEIDLVTTPDGSLVGMVHANNCTSDLNAWVGLFREFAESFGMEVDMNQLFGTLYNKALEGDKDCGGLLSYGYLSGENITGVTEGRPLFVRSPESRFNLANFMRTHLYTSLGALKVGMDILLKEEQVQIDKILGHGGLFKTKGVGQGILAAAIDTPVSVMETAAEGGAWGIAHLASYMNNKAEDEALDDYLDAKVFAGQKGTKMDPDPKDVEGYNTFIGRCAEGRHMTKEAIEKIAEGRVWTGEAAKELGLVDELGGIDKALDIAVAKADIENYTVISYPAKQDFFSSLFETKPTNYVEAQLLKSKLGEYYRQFDLLKNLQEKSMIQARVPFELNIK